MKFHDNKALKTAQWFSNMILRDDDINFLNAAEYKNKVDTLINIFSEATQVLRGLEVTYSTAMTVTLSAGTAISSEGSYFVDDVWDFQVDEGSFIASVPEDQDIGIAVGGTQDRIDIIEIRPVRTAYNPVTRNFKDPITSLVSSAIVNTRVEYGYEFQVTEGTESSSPVAESTTAGWIKMAEVYIAGSATSITQSNIIAVVDSHLWTTDSRGTVLPDPELGVSVSNAVATQKTTTIPKNITQAYTNLVQDPTDLTTANWTPTDVTPAVSDVRIAGLDSNTLTLPGTSAAKIITGAITVSAGVYLSAWVTVRRGSYTGGSVTLSLGSTDSFPDYGNVSISFNTHTVLDGGSSLYSYDWIDTDTISLRMVSIVATAGTTAYLSLSMEASVSDEYCYVSGIQLIEDTKTDFPFVDGSKEAVVIEEAFSMPDKFTLDMIIEPKFAYDTDSTHYQVMWFVDYTHRLRLYYDYSSDTYKLAWYDGGTESRLESSQFDDGTSHVNINQRMRIIGSFDFTNLADSRFIIVPLELGIISEDTSWSYFTDTKSSIFTTLSIGHIEGGGQADSEYEYLRIYEGLLVGDVTKSLDVDAILKNQTLLLDASIDEFKATQIDAGTPVSLAIEMLAEDVKTGVAIQDKAILNRHLAPEVRSPIADALRVLNSNQWDDGVKIVAADPEASDYFGRSVSISGDYAIIGAYGEGSAGAAYIFNRIEGIWDSGIKLAPTDPDPDDYFGFSVSISGDYAIVGANREDAGGISSGAAYIYHRTGTNTWDSGVKIVATDPESGDYFGASVSISGDYAIVGAYLEDTGGNDAGAAYIYNRTGTNTWDSGVKIVASDASADAEFGYGVSISGDYAIVGAHDEAAGGTGAGAAYIFNRTGTNTWDSGIKIVAPDAGSGDEFGCAVSISGDYAIVGAQDEAAGGSSSGAAYIFKRAGTNTWDSGIKIVAPDAEATAYFGCSVSISGDYAAVGAYGKDIDVADVGAAYIYNRTGNNTWDSGVRVLANDPEASDYFGRSVSISGDDAIVGAYLESTGGSDAGAAYIYSETFRALVRLI